MRNIFVLCTGRCGSMTFASAASHISNYSTGHETRTRMIGRERLDYPPSHIEADNRLSWMLGRLGNTFPCARFVHLVRDPEAVARSFASRWGTGIIRAYHSGVMMAPESDRLEICRDYVETVTANIEHFLSGRDSMRFRMEDATEDWPRFWDWIGAEGDYPSSLEEWAHKHNASQPMAPRPGILQRMFSH